MPRHFEDVIDRVTLVELHKKSSWRPVIQGGIVISLFVILIIVSASMDAIWAKLLISVVLGVILSGWFSAIHECVHGLFFKERRLNHIAGVFWAVPTLLNFSIYRYYHLEHHRHTAVDGDPEPRGEFDTIGQYLLSLSTIWFPLRFIRMSILATFSRYPDFIYKDAQKNDVAVDNILLGVWIISIAVLTYMYPTLAIFGYWIPLIVYLPMLSITGIPEHYGCDDVDDILVNTRSVKSNPVFRFFYWNNNFHAEHHTFPQVPFSNLPRLNSLVGHRYKHKASSFRAFHMALILQLIKRNSVVKRSPSK